MKTILMAIAALSLGACQQSMLTRNPSSAGYKAETARAVGHYATSLSDSYANARGVSSSSYPFGSNGSYGLPFGGSFMMPSVEGELNRCLDMVKGVQKTAANFELRLSTLSRCLTVLLNYRNPINTLGFQGMNSTGQQGWLYSLNYPMPGTLQDFSSTAFGGWNQYAGSGLFGYRP